MRILVTGSKGQLGSEIARLAKSNSTDQFTFVDIDEMDLGNKNAIEKYFEDKQFDTIINCAAYTAVDKAEEDSVLAYKINAEAAGTIATICQRKSIRLIHISTDYVFDGEGNRPIAEDAKPNPLSVYGKSKLEGEQAVLRILDNAYVIRTAWVYSTFGKNFVKTIAKLAREREVLNVVDDQIGSPTYARDLAVAILTIITKINGGETDVPGIYHYTNEGVISWYDFAWFIIKHYNLPCRVNAIPSEMYPTPAVRPKFSVLDKRKLKKTFKIEIPHWHESLVTCLAALP